MRTLRCMAYPQEGVYVAACLDLSLAAQADTMQEAMKKLDEQIKEYLAEAMSEPEYEKQLLSRKAPLPLWFKYYWFALLIRFPVFYRRRRSKAKLFAETCDGLA